MSGRRRGGYGDPAAAARGRRAATSSSPTSRASSTATVPVCTSRCTGSPTRPTRRASPAPCTRPSWAPTCSSGVSAPNVIDGDDVAEHGRATRSSSRWPTRCPRSTRALAREHAAVVATGRSDYPNQINNVLAFPGVFRGLLDASAQPDRRHPAGRRRGGDRRRRDGRRAQRELHHPERVPRRRAHGGRGRRTDGRGGATRALHRRMPDRQGRAPDVGDLLVATPALLDPNFERTVVLVLDLDDNGALGVVLNRPVDGAGGRGAARTGPTSPRTPDVLFQGGPVSTDSALAVGASMTSASTRTPSRSASAGCTTTSASSTSTRPPRSSRRR